MLPMPSGQGLAATVLQARLATFLDAVGSPANAQLSISYERVVTRLRKFPLFSYATDTQEDGCNTLDQKQYTIP